MLLAMARETLSAKQRLKKRWEFLSLQSKGRKLRTEHLLLAARFYSKPATKQGGSPETSRLGITVTTKIDKRAVQRNRLKRRIREIFRRKRKSFGFPVDVVVIALAGACNLSSVELEEQLSRALGRLGIIEIEQ